MICAYCGDAGLGIYETHPEWTVCIVCGAILGIEKRAGQLVAREAEPGEFLDLISNSRTYGMLLLLQDEIKARQRLGK